MSSIMRKIWEEGRNNLLVAAEKGDLTEFQRLLGIGVEPATAKGLKDFTALHYAASRGHLAIVQELLNVGMMVDVRTATGETPLHLAVYSGHLLVVEQLLDNNADVNAVNEDNETPLIYASSQGKPLIVRELLQRGARIDILDSIVDESAMDRAKDRRTVDMFEMILGKNSVHATAAGVLDTSRVTEDLGLLSLAPAPSSSSSSGSGSNNNSRPCSSGGSRSLARHVAGILPYRVLLNLFEFLDIKDICTAGSVNSKWYRVSQDNTNIWCVRVGMKRWEYALRHAMGFASTATSSFLSFAPKAITPKGGGGSSSSTKSNNSNSRSNNNNSTKQSSALGSRKPSGSNSTIVSGSNSNDIADFF